MTYFIGLHEAQAIPAKILIYKDHSSLELQRDYKKDNNSNKLLPCGIKYRSK